MWQRGRDQEDAGDKNFGEEPKGEAMYGGDLSDCVSAL